MKIFGYGTFITSGIYRKFTKVRSAYLLGYARILRPGDLFPFILQKTPENPNNSTETGNSGFWGLVFDVSPERLEELDFYEGSLYTRIQVKCMYLDGETDEVMVYYPTEEIIELYNLRNYITNDDPWRDKIVHNHPAIIEQFPELARSEPPGTF
ncbi:MAG: gamma-glutamylcyclotransferase [Candidatus Lokiarchaeota archaeon]|nr:gamma-glutamylcyclotransferase [Candidatus Lokiarchaeota archaeon]